MTYTSMHAIKTAAANYVVAFEANDDVAAKRHWQEWVALTQSVGHLTTDELDCMWEAGDCHDNICHMSGLL